jgi:hypothetical protein
MFVEPLRGRVIVGWEIEGTTLAVSTFQVLLVTVAFCPILTVAE